MDGVDHKEIDESVVDLNHVKRVIGAILMHDWPAAVARGFRTVPGVDK